MSRHAFLKLSLESLESRRCLATVVFGEPIAISDARHDRVLVDDWNADGLTDVIISKEHSFSIVLNLGNGDFAAGPTVVEFSLNSITTMDRSGNGNLDVIGIAGVGRASFRPFARDEFGQLTRQPIIWPDNPPSGGYQFISGDLNGDGNDDLLVGDCCLSLLWMYLATADASRFEPGVVIGINGAFPRSLSTADLDHDGDLDVLRTGRYSGLMWLENTNGDASVWTQRTIDPREGGHASEAADIDSDGDLDLISHGLGLQLARNDGQGNFGIETNLTHNSFPYSSVLRTSDLDADGDVDVVMYSRDQGLVLFENLDGMGRLGTGVTVLSPNEEYGYQLDGSLRFFDADRDGDDDLVLAGTQSVFYFENLTLRGDLTNDGVVDARDIDQLFAAARNELPSAAGDLTGDGQADGQDIAFLVRDILGSNVGDSNLDGAFDSSDLVLIFATGKYEDDVDGNSGWEDGDWDGDGDFTTADLVAAFQRGNYIS